MAMILMAFSAAGAFALGAIEMILKGPPNAGLSLWRFATVQNGRRRAMMGMRALNVGQLFLLVIFGTWFVGETLKSVAHLL